jgi:multidrug efflux pump subunit AcrA (membrane-fusion protein)
LGVAKTLGLDRLVIMPSKQALRSHQGWMRGWIKSPVTAVMMFTIGGGIGCHSGDPAKPGVAPVMAASPAAGSDAFKPGPTPSPFAGQSAYAAGPPDGHNFTTSGPLVVEQQADVTAQRDGLVTAVKVEIGDHVHRGEILALLDDRALEAARAEKAARIDSLSAQVRSWEAEQKSNEADLRRADAMRAEKSSTMRIGNTCNTSSPKRPPR